MDSPAVRPIKPRTDGVSRPLLRMAPMQTLSMRVIYIARKYLFNTWLGKTKLAARIYAAVFELSAPDLTKPLTFRDTSLYVDPDDRSCVPSMVGGYFEQRELDIFEAIISDADVFFDVGANVGLYSVIGCTKSAGLNAYAFEPVAENQALLQKNIVLHGLEDRLRLEPVAVSDHAGTTRIYLHHSGTHSIENSEGGNGRDVKTVSLDEFTSEHDVGPAVMKIDVEGHEGAVLAGATQTLARYAPTIFFEFIPIVHRDVESLVRTLSALYTTCYVVDTISGDVTETRPADLDRKKGCNIILTSNERHIGEIRRFVTA